MDTQVSSELKPGGPPQQSASGVVAVREPERMLSREAYALLAQANLLRMRGSWPEATEKCMAALRLSPDNPSAQSLLGDIYENQGRLDDAIQWYRMALDVQPDSPADRIKLTRLLDLKANSLPAQTLDKPTPPGPSVPSPLSSSQPFWLLRWRSNPDGMLRCLAFVTGALAILIVFAAFLLAHRSTPSGFSGDSHRVDAPPVVVPSLALSPVAAAPPASSAVPADPAEASVLALLQASPLLTGEGITVSSSAIDPRDGTLTVTMTCRPPAGTPLDRGLMLRDATRVLQIAAQQADPRSISQFTVRCLLAPATGGETPLVFTADATRPAVAALNPDLSLTTTIQLAAIYTNIWWASSLRP